MPQKRNEFGVFISTGQYNKCSICDNDFYVKNCHKDRKFCSRKCYWQSMVGGKQSKKTISRRIKSRENYKHSQETKDKIGKAHRGDKNWSWRGGISKLRNRQFSQVKHREWRKAVFERDDYTCQKCKIRGGKLEAHHIKPFAYFSDLRYEVDNGLTLCKSCHLKETIKERKVNWTNQFVKREVNMEYFENERL